MKSAFLLGMAAVAMVSSAQAAVLDSSTFAYSYDANAKPGAASPVWTRSGFGPNDNVTASVNSGVLTINTNPTDEYGANTQSSNLYAISDPALSWSVQANKSFAAEFRVLVNSAPDNATNLTTKNRSGLKLAIGDGLRQANITILDSAVRATGTTAVAGNVFSTALNQGTWHTFQIAVSPDHLSYNVFRDTLLLTAVAEPTVAVAGDSIFFGDDNNFGTTINNQGRDINVGIDYVRWDAAITVPEPAAIGLVGLSGLLLRRRR